VVMKELAAGQVDQFIAMVGKELMNPGKIFF
jgi:hypothetical protein